MQDNWTLLTTLLAGVSTLAIFSFLIKENAFYRFFEHLFIGLAAGLLPVLTIRDYLWPKVLEPMLGYAEGPYNPYYLLYLIPMAFGLLYYCIFSKRNEWLAKLVIGFSLGASGGLAFKGFFAEVLPQIFGSFKPLVVMQGSEIVWMKSINNTLFVGILLIVLYYFFFTVKTSEKKNSGVSRAGRLLLMVCFGAFFGSTVMARLALLVERVQFLIEDWAGAVGVLFT